MNAETHNETPASKYDFELPKELIAQQPTRNREDARLLVVDRERQQIEHAHFRDIVDWFRPGDCLVLNETKVIPAKLVGYRTRTKGRWQGLYLDRDEETGILKVMCKDSRQDSTRRDRDIARPRRTRSNGRDDGHETWRRLLGDQVGRRFVSR